MVGIAALNLRQLRSGDSTRLAGAKTRLLPRALRDGQNALLAIPIGLLFGFGFETSSQVAAYAVAFGADAGVWGAVVVGSMFCFGMIVTDTLDSVLVHRFISFSSDSLPRIMRVWILSVTIFALAVAAYEVLQVCGRQPPVSDIQVSAALVIALSVVFGYVFYQTRARARCSSYDTPPVAAIPLGEFP